MKRLLSILALLSLLTPALMAQYPHFREWGFYGTASYTMMTSFTRIVVVLAILRQAL